jgi:hypothetical protein
MMYKTNVATSSEIRAKHSKQSEHHVQILKVKNLMVRQETTRN